VHYRHVFEKMLKFNLFAVTVIHGEGKVKILAKMNEMRRNVTSEVQMSFLINL